MGLRLSLHSKLCDLLGTRNVYFQPPESIKLSYPCIVYSRDSVSTTFADNNPYSHTKRYAVMVISKDPDSILPDKLAMMKTSSFKTQFTSNNLHHTVFTIYY